MAGSHIYKEYNYDHLLNPSNILFSHFHYGHIVPVSVIICIDCAFQNCGGTTRVRGYHQTTSQNSH